MIEAVNYRLERWSEIELTSHTQHSSQLVTLERWFEIELTSHTHCYLRALCIRKRPTRPRGQTICRHSRKPANW